MFLVLGCASLDKNECLHADWYAIGLEDGARGRALERLGDHRRACAKHSVTPDAAACPQPQAQNFIAGYNRGRELHEMHRQLEQLNGEIGRIKAALKEGIANPRTRGQEVERLEALTREAEQLELHIQQAERP